jgi:heme exporter protein B
MRDSSLSSPFPRRTSKFFSIFLILLRKEMLLLIRSRNFLWALLFLALLLATTTSASLSLAWIPQEQKNSLFPPLLWLVLILSCVITLEKNYEKETEASGFLGVLLTGTSPSIIYLAKVTALSLCIGSLHFVTSIMLGVLVAPTTTWISGSLLFVSLLTIVGFAALAILVQPMSASSRLGGLLLPLLLFPLLFPLFFSASTLASDIVMKGTFDIGSFSLTLLLILDVVYLALGINMYEFAVRG